MGTRWLLPLVLAVLAGSPLAAQAPGPSPSPSPEPPPAVPQGPAAGEAEPGGESPAQPAEDQATILDKIGTFSDIEQLDLGSLLSVSAESGAARTVDDSPFFVTVVTEEDIRRTGATSLLEVVRTLAGFEVLSDSLGRSRIVVRGVSSGAGSPGVLLLMNGQRLNEGLHGGATVVNLQVPVDNIKRIEVRRGAGTALDGPGAYQAVIDVTTEAADTFRKTELTLGGGSFGSFLYNFRYGSTWHSVSLTGFLQYSRTGGASLDVGEDTQTVLDRALTAAGIPDYTHDNASLAPGETADDRKSVDANLSAVWRSFVFNFRRKEDSSGGYVGILGALGPQNQIGSRQLGLDATWRRSLAWGDLRVTAGYAQSNLAEFFQPFPPGFTVVRKAEDEIRYPFTIETPVGRPVRYGGGLIFQDNLNVRRIGTEGSLSRRVRGHGLVGGILLERESTYGLEALSNFDPFTHLPLQANAVREDRLQGLEDLVPTSARTTLALYAQDGWDPRPELGLSAGLRLESRTDFGTAFLPRLGAVWRLPRGLNLKATYSRGERTPTLGELSLTSPALEANPVLRSSAVDAFEAGAVYNGRGLRLSLVAYASALHDVVMAVPRPGGLPARLVNVEGVDAKGLELEAARTFGDRTLRLRYSLQAPTLADGGDRLPDVARHLLHLDGFLPAGKYLTFAPALLVCGGRVRAAGDLRDDPDGYALLSVDIRARNFHRAIEASASIHNLLGTESFDPSPLHALPGDYPRAGRALLVKVKYRLGP